MNQDAFELSKRFRFSLDSPESSVVADALLLKRFVNTQDQEAFTELLERHGPIVWGVCRRQLRNPMDVEDVFQATFLVLFQNASRIDKHTSLASWLHGVARRIASKLNRTAARQQQRERSLAQSEAQSEEVTWDRTEHEVIDTELARLPAQYREPLLLCYLQGQSQALAAKTLGWPIGTVAGRLSRAKELLRSRLVRRGVTPAVIASLGIEQALAQVPAGLLEKTMNTMGTGGTTAVALLAKGGVAKMWISKWLMIGAIGLCLSAAVGVGYSAWRGQTPQGDKPASETSSIISTPPTTQDEHPDYKAIQGRWRHEQRHEVTDTLLWVQDLTFRGRKYAKTTYPVEKNGIISGRTNETSALEYVLDPSKTPKEMELQEADITKLNKVNFDKAVERSLCTYELIGDTLMIHYHGNVIALKNAKGEIIRDRNSTDTRFPADDKGTTTLVYHRIQPEKPTTDTKPDTTTRNTNEQAERVKLMQERVEASEEVFKLRYQAYLAGKETINFLLESLSDRLNAKLELAGHTRSDTQAAIQEALDSAEEDRRGY